MSLVMGVLIQKLKMAALKLYLVKNLGKIVDVRHLYTFKKFSREEYWSGLPFPSAGDLTNPGLELTSLASPALTGGFLTIGYLGSW